MLPQWIIEKKRDGHELSKAELEWFIRGFTSGEIPDYQMAALAMAIYFKSMTLAEATTLTDCMMRSGSVVDTSSIPLPKVDKHSTGGIGDKVSLILAPLVACCGVAVPMISGRGLGITGGTLDKLESIPGFRVDLSEARFIEVLKKCGVSMIGQTKDIAPADKKLYGLRDVTGTVPSIPLIVASIMCKKLAEGIDGLVLDVKVGSGAFMKTLADARQLADWMVKVGTGMGKKMVALITAMNEPLGRTSGNALEVVESVQTLKGEGPKDLWEVTLELCAEMLVLAGRAKSVAEAKPVLESKIASGEALNKFKELVLLHNGDARAIEDLSLLAQAKVVEPILSESPGFIQAVSAEAIGRGCLMLGAGRQKVSDSVDHAVGVSGLKKIGEEIKTGEALCYVHANSREQLAASIEIMRPGFVVSAHKPNTAPLVLERIYS